MPAANWTLDQVVSQLRSGTQWAGTTITYAFPLSASGMYGQDEAAGFTAVPASQQALFQLAITAWDDLMPQSFVLGTAGQTDIEFAFTTTGIEYAHAYYPSDGSVWFLTGSDVANPTIGTYAFGTILHELGHALGLNHMGEYNGEGGRTPSSFQDSQVLSIMSYFGPLDTDPGSMEVMQADWIAADQNLYSQQTPMVNDIVAIQAIYGVSSTTRTGDTIYGFGCNITGASVALFDFSTNLTPILTLFDSGGTDTLNLAGYNTASVISLVPGTYSSCNFMTYNIGIAYSAVIENAVGGDAGDQITGNTAANLLSGAAGNDTLWGGTGNDTLMGGSGDDVFYGEDGNDTVTFSGNFADYTITWDEAQQRYSVSSLAEGNDFAYGAEFFAFADSTRALAGADLTAPTLASRTPADDAGSVAIASNIVLTFNEEVRAGTGSIIIFTAGGTAAHTISVGDTTQVTFSGSTVTINPAADLLHSQSYYVSVAAGAIVDAAGNAFAGITGTTAYNFTTVPAPDTTAPTVASASPADEAGNVAISSNIVLTFSEAIQRGTGSIVLKTAAGAVIATYDAATSANVTVSGHTLTIDPSANLANGTAYKVEFAAGTVKDLAGNSYAGTTSYNFTTRPAGTTHTGSTGSDSISGTMGDDTIDGGAGRDTIVYAGAKSAYSIQKQDGVIRVSGPEGDDRLTNVERVKFSDFHVAFDIDGNAGMAYRLYKAAFDRLPDVPGLGYQMNDLDIGHSLVQVAANFIASPEFQTTYGNVSNAQFVTLLYRNVLDREPEPDGLQYHVNRLAIPGVTRADILVGFSESPENKLNVIGQIENGMVYTL